jgi:DNA repair protein RadA/Sms
LNIAGGLRIAEPAADLACALALISALTDRPVPDDIAIFGEVGLSGEIRRVTQAESRLREAAKLGFRRALAPQAVRAGTARGGRASGSIEGLDLQEVGHLQEMIDWLYNESRSNAVPKRPDMVKG